MHLSQAVSPRVQIPGLWGTQGEPCILTFFLATLSPEDSRKNRTSSLSHWLRCSRCGLERLGSESFLSSASKEYLSVGCCPEALIDSQEAHIQSRLLHSEGKLPRTPSQIPPPRNTLGSSCNMSFSRDQALSSK